MANERRIRPSCCPDLPRRTDWVVDKRLLWEASCFSWEAYWGLLGGICAAPWGLLGTSRARAARSMAGTIAPTAVRVALSGKRVSSRACQVRGQSVPPREL